MKKHGKGARTGRGTGVEEKLDTHAIKVSHKVERKFWNRQFSSLPREGLGLLNDF